MDTKILQFLAGRTLISDTKARKIESKKSTLPNAVTGDVEQDPHKRFIKFVIQEKPKKKDIVVHIQKFIDQAESLL